MNKVTLEVRLLADTLQDFAATWKSGEASEPRISFETPELLWEVLTAKRWEIIKAMTGTGALAIREIALRVERDVKTVHGDVHALLNAGILEKSEHGIVFPYDAVHVDFMLETALLEGLSSGEPTEINATFWQSIYDKASVPLHDWQKTELDKRYSAYKQGKVSTQDTDEVHSRLREAHS